MMKKMLTMILALMMALTMLPAMADGEKEKLPEEIAELFDVPAWEEYEVPYTTKYPDKLAYIWLEHSDFGLVLQRKEGLNVLCVIERDSKGEMRITIRNYTTIFGDYVPVFDSTPYQTPEVNTVTLDIYGDSYYLMLVKIGGVWRVKQVQDYEAEMMAGVSSDRIVYYEMYDNGDFLDYDPEAGKTVYGTYDNRFAGFNIYAFPKTVAEAREKLTNPPVTPTDFYTPQVITLRAGEQYDVFAAPGRSSYRAANGKAVMSTNDWVQIFGEENGWVLVQYDISRDQMRFGYVDASVLPKDTEVQSLHWYDLPAQTIKYNVSVTDDPLVSGNIIHSLRAGDSVKVLSEFGNWYYIETNDSYGKLLRGFVPQSCIDIVTDADMVG